MIPRRILANYCAIGLVLRFTRFSCYGIGVVRLPIAWSHARTKASLGKQKGAWEMSLLEWMWADAGDYAGGVGATVARWNPLRWSEGTPTGVHGKLAAKRGDDELRGVLLRTKGAGSCGWEFDCPGSAAAWIQHTP